MHITHCAPIGWKVEVLGMQTLRSSPLLLNRRLHILTIWNIPSLFRFLIESLPRTVALSKPTVPILCWWPSCLPLEEVTERETLLTLVWVPWRAAHWLLQFFTPWVQTVGYHVYSCLWIPVVYPLLTCPGITVSYKLSLKGTLNCSWRLISHF